MRKRLSRIDWLNAAIRALAQGGIASVSINRLATELSVTRGSFYHHFAGRDELLDEMLGYWVNEWTVAVREEVRDRGLNAAEALLALMQTIRKRKAADHDTAFRAWALHDPRARRVVRKADELRLTYIRGLFKEIGFEDLEAENRARLMLYYEICEASFFAGQTSKMRNTLVSLRHAFLVLTAEIPASVGCQKNQTSNNVNADQLAGATKRGTL